MSTQPTVLILLSTYNGAKYLKEQLDSIVAQTWQHWILLIRDDGSSDQTVEIIKQYCAANPRIILMMDDLGNLGVQKSFSTLMLRAVKRQDPYIFFCDQDDVWLPNKLELSINLLKNMQRNTDSNHHETPLLVHSDLRVVDTELKTIHPSYLAYEKLKRNTQSPINTLLINNYITGCTIGMNRALLNMAYPVPEQAFMHDWWCALCAAATGKIGFVDEVTMLYRQHRGNSIGSSGFYKKFRDIFSLKTSFTRRKANHEQCFKQAKSLLSRMNDHNENYPLIDNFASLKEKPLLPRYTQAFMLRLKPAGSLRNLLFWIFLGLKTQTNFSRSRNS